MGPVRCPGIIVGAQRQNLDPKFCTVYFVLYMFRFVYNYVRILYLHVLILVAGVDGRVARQYRVYQYAAETPTAIVLMPACPCKNCISEAPCLSAQLQALGYTATTASRVHCSGRVSARSDQIQDQTISPLITNAHLSSYLQHIGNQIKPNQGLIGDSPIFNTGPFNPTCGSSLK